MVFSWESQCHLRKTKEASGTVWLVGIRVERTPVSPMALEIGRLVEGVQWDKICAMGSVNPGSERRQQLAGGSIRGVPKKG